MTMELKSLLTEFDDVTGRIVNSRMLPGSLPFAVPVPDDPSWSPAQSDLDAATDTVIALENAQNEANAVIEALMVDRVELFARYNAAWHEAGSSAEVATDIDYVNSVMTSTTDYLDALYNAWTGYRTEVQAMLSVWTAARAKIEHDIAWQAYVASRYGDTDIERASARPALDLKLAA